MLERINTIRRFLSEMVIKFSDLDIETIRADMYELVSMLVLNNHTSAFKHIHAEVVQALQSMKLTINDLRELVEFNDARMLMLHSVLADIITQQQITIFAAHAEIMQILNGLAPTLKGDYVVVLRAGDISVFDSAYAFSQLRLQAADALIAISNVNAAEAMEKIQRSSLAEMKKIPGLAASAKYRVMQLVEERGKSVTEVEQDVFEYRKAYGTNRSRYYTASDARVVLNGIEPVYLKNLFTQEFRNNLSIARDQAIVKDRMELSMDVYTDLVLTKINEYDTAIESLRAHMAWIDCHEEKECDGFINGKIMQAKIDDAQREKFFNENPQRLESYMPEYIETHFNRTTTSAFGVSFLLAATEHYLENAQSYEIILAVMLFLILFRNSIQKLPTNPARFFKNCFSKRSESIVQEGDVCTNKFN